VGALPISIPLKVKNDPDRLAKYRRAEIDPDQ
jgi:hypothetical protein